MSANPLHHARLVRTTSESAAGINMTVIALLGSLDSFPVLFGDLLLSGDECPGRAATIPSIGNVRNFFPGGSGWTIVGLGQKLAIVAPNCAVAWCGSAYGARLAIQQLKDLAGGQRLVQDQINLFLQSIDPEARKQDFSLLGLLLDGPIAIEFRHNLSSLTVTGVGEIALEGSGQPMVASVLQRLPPRSSMPEVSNWAYSVGAAAGLAGLLISMEQNSGATLRHYFGGGYELALAAAPDRVEKLDDILFVVWDDEMVVGGAHMPSPVFLMRNQYVGEALVMKSVNLHGGKHSQIRSHVAFPPYILEQQPLLPAPERIDWNASKVIHCFLVRTADGVREYTVFEANPLKDQRSITVIERGVGLLFGFGLPFLASVRDSIWAAFGRTPAGWLGPQAPSDFGQAMNGTSSGGTS